MIGILTKLRKESKMTDNENSNLSSSSSAPIKQETSLESKKVSFLVNIFEDKFEEKETSLIEFPKGAETVFQSEINKFCKSLSPKDLIQRQEELKNLRDWLNTHLIFRDDKENEIHEHRGKGIINKLKWEVGEISITNESGQECINSYLFLIIIKTNGYAQSFGTALTPFDTEKNCKIYDIIKKTLIDLGLKAYISERSTKNRVVFLTNELYLATLNKIINQTKKTLLDVNIPSPVIDLCLNYFSSFNEIEEAAKKKNTPENSLSVTSAIKPNPSLI